MWIQVAIGSCGAGLAFIAYRHPAAFREDLGIPLAVPHGIRLLPCQQQIRSVVHFPIIEPSEVKARRKGGESSGEYPH